MVAVPHLLSTSLRLLAPTDGLVILTLAALEGILSVDNSLVLAILVRTLPKEQQKKALSYGIIGAFAFRFLALLLAAHLMQFTIFKAVGGLYLLYLAMKHMFFVFKEDANQVRPATAANFWRMVLVVELTDIAFSIDSITTAVAMSTNLVVVWAGGILGIIFLRFAAGFFIRLLEKLPRLEDLAYQLIFFIGSKLLLESFHIEISHTVFWIMMAVITILGSSLVYRDYYQTVSRTKHENRLQQQVGRGELSLEDIFAMEYVPGDLVKLLIDRGDLVIRRPL
jgi:YkoY family integral membrane protein